MKESAGTLLYRKGAEAWEVLIVCPSGPAARYGWSIPKGIPDAAESLEDAARRETLEETGVKARSLTYLGYTDYKKSKKRIHCYAGNAPSSEPYAASWEVSAARFVSVDEAKKLLHPDQCPFVERLMVNLK